MQAERAAMRLGARRAKTLALAGGVVRKSCPHMAYQNDYAVGRPHSSDLSRHRVLKSTDTASPQQRELTPHDPSDVASLRL